MRTPTVSSIAILGTELAYEVAGGDGVMSVDRARNPRASNERKRRLKTPPKDLTTLTFFFSAAYTRSATETLEQERRTRGQERRDGL